MAEQKHATSITFFDDKTNDGRNSAEKISSALWFIMLGVILLLNSTGIVPWSVWGKMIIIYFKLWPLAIVGIGIGILLGESKIAKLISGILWTALFALVFLISASQVTSFKLPTWFNDKIANMEYALPVSLPVSFPEELDKNFN